MSEHEIVYTERDMVLARRGAFESGVHWFYGQPEVSVSCGHLLRTGEGKARELYPLPKVTRPRELADPTNKGVRWRVADGVLQVSPGGGEWLRPDTSWGLTAVRISLWAELFANPTEEVEAES